MRFVQSLANCSQDAAEKGNARGVFQFLTMRAEDFAVYLTTSI
jgi:hypothetical protein